MYRSVLVFGFATLLAVLGLSSPAMAGPDPPSASSTDTNPMLFPDEVTTTTSVGNPDGSHTVTTTDSEGNVTEQHTVPGDPGPGYSTLEEVQAEIERQANEDNEWLEGWEEDFPDADEPNADGPESAVPPPETPWQEADDALIDMEEQIRDLRYLHNQLLDQAAQTEDRDAFQELVDQAQQTLNEMYELQDAHDDAWAELGNSMSDDLEYIDTDAMAQEIEDLEDQLDGFPEAIDQAETDEEAEALEQDQADAESELEELQGELDGINEEVLEGAIQRAEERHRRDTGRQGAAQRPQIPNVSHGPPSMGGRPSPRGRY